MASTSPALTGPSSAASNTNGKSARPPTNGHKFVSRSGGHTTASASAAAVILPPPFIPTSGFENDPAVMPQRDPVGLTTGLRPIVIDGSNLAMAHGNKETFSCRGIKLAVDWFRARGHREITVFVPKYRKEQPRLDNPIREQALLLELEQERRLVFTPSRFVNGKRTVCHDDRYILKLASEIDGVVVSNDNYRDLTGDNAEFKRVVNERLLMYSFVNDRFMPPDDPLGRTGPTLDNFLRLHPK